MNGVSRKWLRIGAILVVVLVFINIALSLIAISRLTRHTEIISQSYGLQNQLNALLLSVVNAETGQRGFLITGEERYLEPYHDAVERVGNQLIAVKAAVRADSYQRALLERIEQHLKLRLDLLETSIRIRRNDGFDEARDVLMSGKGKAEMDILRGLVTDLLNDERAKIDNLAIAGAALYGSTLIINFISGLAALSVVCAFFGLSGKYHQANEKFTRDIFERGERLRVTLASIGDGVITTDASGKVTNLNPVAEKLTGWSNSEASDCTLETVFHICNETTRQEVPNPAIRALREGQIIGLANHTLLIRRDGTECPIDDSAAPIRHKDGSIIGSVLVFRDVSERRKYESQLAHSELTFRATFDNAPIGIAYMGLDGHLVQVNDRLAALLSYERDALRALTLHDLLDDEARSRIVQPLERLVSGRSDLETMECQVFDRDNKPILVRITISSVRDDKGEPFSLVTLIEDIRAWKASEETRMRMAAIVESSNDPIIGKTLKGIVTSWNPAAEKLFGYSASEMIGQSILRIVPKSKHDEELDLLHRLEEGERINQFETQRICRDGTRVDMILNISPIKDSAGQLVGLSTIAHDITERKQYENSIQQARIAAEQANKSRGQFLANMSHEIRTPMTAILGYTDILAEHIQDPDNLQCVDTIRRNGRYLLEIINDILDLSKIDSGKLQIDRERVSLYTIMHDVQTLMDVRAQEKQIAFETKSLGRLPQTIETDPIRLRQILFNLTGNAIKFTNKGKVVLTARYLEESNQAEFEIIDTGIGISEEDIKKLFVPFMQSDASSTRAYEGTGLGLAISRRLAQALGGDIRVRSRVGEGSVFTLTIQCGSIDGIEMVDATRNVEPHEFLPLETRLDGCILVVDDRRDIRFLAQHFLEQAGGRVITATNGREAIELLTQPSMVQDEIDVVIMDMQMPVMDGYHTVRQLRNLGYSKPIIALTAHAMKEDRDRCLEAGCDDYITKPLEGPRFVNTVANYLYQKH